MDVDTVDHEYTQLEQEAQQTGQSLQTLAGKLQAAGDAGDANAKEWILDLKAIALQIQQEQLQMQALLQALHGLTVNTMQQLPAQALPGPGPAPAVAAVSQPQAAPPQGGGLLQRFMGGGFGQAMGMGAAFGIGDSLINSLFN